MPRVPQLADRNVRDLGLRFQPSTHPFALVVCGRSTIRSGRGEAAHLYDEEHSREEDRWVTLGRSSRGDILVVVHTFDEQSDGNVAVRIISARQATKREMQRYEANL